MSREVPPVVPGGLGRGAAHKTPAQPQVPIPACPCHSRACFLWKYPSTGTSTSAQPWRWTSTSSTAREKEANPSISPITQVILRDRAAWFHQQDLIFCSVVFLLFFEDLNAADLIQLSTQQLLGLKDACDLWSGISLTLRCSLGNAALFTWCSLPRAQWEQAWCGIWCDPLKTTSVAFSDVSSNKKTSDLGKGLGWRKGSNIYSSEWG